MSSVCTFHERESACCSEPATHVAVRHAWSHVAAYESHAVREGERWIPEFCAVHAEAVATQRNTRQAEALAAPKKTVALKAPRCAGCDIPLRKGDTFSVPDIGR